MFYVYYEVFCNLMCVFFSFEDLGVRMLGWIGWSSSDCLVNNVGGGRFLFWFSCRRLPALHGI